VRLRGEERDMARRFNPPPNWPTPPEGFTPEPGWKPDPSWPPPPEGWQLWVDEPRSGNRRCHPPRAMPHGTPTGAPGAVVEPAIDVEAIPAERAFEYLEAAGEATVVRDADVVLADTQRITACCTHPHMGRQVGVVYRLPHDAAGVQVFSYQTTRGAPEFVMDACQIRQSPSRRACL
jgi:hypothetical protein